MPNALDCMRKPLDVKVKKPCDLHVRELSAEGVQGGGEDNVRWEAVPNGMVEGRNDNFWACNKILMVILK